MAVRKREPKKAASHNPYDWENNDNYPVKRDVCDFCGHKDELKLSFDQIRYICINAHVCVNRWRRERNGE